jgi:hypothetical protein
MTSEVPRPAGSFGAWLTGMRAVLRGERAADVPCDGCVGCCVSSYVIPLRPADSVALATVTAAHLRLPVDGGLAQMTPREDGTCPMLEDGRCTIYAGRPQTCRDYDCRIYAATGLLPDGERPVIRQRVLEWRFEFGTESEIAQSAALRRAAQFIRANAALFPAAARAESAAAVAVMAVKSWPLFVDGADVRQAGDVSHDVALQAQAQVECVLAAARAFHGT